MKVRMKIRGDTESIQRADNIFAEVVALRKDIYKIMDHLKISHDSLGSPDEMEPMLRY